MLPFASISARGPLGGVHVQARCQRGESFRFRAAGDWFETIKSQYLRSLVVRVYSVIGMVVPHALAQPMLSVDV